MIQAGWLEICRFVPSALLKGIEPGSDIELDLFLGLLARARYLQELEIDMVQRGVVGAFDDGSGKG